MNNAHMTATVQRFLARIDDANEKLKSFSSGVQGRENKVEELLNKMIQGSKGNLPSNIEKGDVVQEKMLESLRHFAKVITQWTECIQEAKRGQAFIHENEKHILVMVFGKVKTGKSSLGNFLAGKPFLNASFPNGYKKRYSTADARPVFKIEIQGREDNMDGEWFREGVVDTTGAIQHFTMPGLRWVDSPGTGAVHKEGDTCDMEQLVREYLNYADFGVFLMSSDSPGLQPDFKYINRLQEHGKPAIVLITKSDRNEEKIVDGNIVACWAAKQAVDRQAQENWIHGELTRIGVQDKFHVLSLSTYLANKGIETQDDEKFRQSQMDLFMELLGERIEKETVQLKEINPKENINRLIRGILQGVEGDDKQRGYKGARVISREFEEVLNFIAENKAKLIALEQSVVQKILSVVKPELNEELTNRARQVEQQKITFSGKDISRRTAEILHRVATRVLDEKISEVINNFSNERLKLSVNIRADVDLKNEQETVEHKVVHYSRVKREPDGWWENFRSIFGKEYYSNEKTEKSEFVNFYVGTNLQSVLDSMMEIVDKQTKKVVHEELHRLAEEYFAPQEAYIRSVQNQLQKFQSAISKLAYPLDEKQ